MDTISDLLTRIRNAKARQHDKVVCPYSKMKWDLVKVISKEGFLGEVVKIGKDKPNKIEISLIYEKNQSKISSLKRISKPSRRVYQGYRDLRRVLNGLGIAILSTPQGIMTNREARKKKLGGEIICEIY